MKPDSVHQEQHQEKQGGTTPEQRTQRNAPGSTTHKNAQRGGGVPTQQHDTLGGTTPKSTQRGGGVPTQQHDTTGGGVPTEDSDATDTAAQFPAVLDNSNEQATVAAYLRHHLRGTQMFRVVSAYFSVYGFAALEKRLQQSAMKVRILFGSPTSAAEMNTGEQGDKSFSLAEEGLVPISNIVLQRRQLADRCAAWVKQKHKRVEIRTITGSFLHGKMYHMEAPSGTAAVVGSSNFTQHGLGVAKNSNMELNIALREQAGNGARTLQQEQALWQDKSKNLEFSGLPDTPQDPTHNTLRDLKKWFDNLWNSNTVRDAKQEVLSALERWHEEYPPQFVYYKTLLELFRDNIDARAASDSQLRDIHLYDSEIWKAMYEFQQDGARSAINKLLMHNGCILADSVGLGKTYTALGVIKYFELRNESVLVLCPKKIIENWRIYQESANSSHNLFIDDHFRYTLLAHTDLTRKKGQSGNVDLATFNWGSYNLVVIDESHNFRNASKSSRDEHGTVTHYSRYERLLQDIIKSGSKTKVLMLSATPVNTSLNDLQNQIDLITEKRDDAFAHSLHIKDIRQVIKAAQKKFKDWETKKTAHGTKHKEELLENLGGEFTTLLSGITIARSRQQIKKFYADFIKQEGDFPQRTDPQNREPSTDTKEQISYESLCRYTEKLKFRIYCPSSYIKDSAVSVKKRLDAEKKEHNFNQQTRETFLVGMMQTNMMKRMESSVYACACTLKRSLDRIDEQLEKINAYIEKSSSAADVEQQEYIDVDHIDNDYELEEDEEFVVSRKAKVPYYYHQLDIQTWRSHIIEDKKALTDVLEQVQKVTPVRDGKLARLKEDIRHKAQQPNRKILLFTTFKDTAEYLHQELGQLTNELNMKMDIVRGGDKNFGDTLNCFAPMARQQPCAADQQIDLLIATDCISEGQNLQDCDTVINYDIHWNPVRLIQRFGRIDRIGSKNATVRMINYWPTPDMDAYLQLGERVHARMALVDITATGEENILDEDVEQEAQLYINFRNQQIKNIRNEIIDLDEVDDSVSMSDLTLDYFFTQLLRYLQHNSTALKQAPLGIYAVADSADAKGAAGSQHPSAIFFFQQTINTPNTNKSPTHPFYLVHVNASGVRHRYTNQQITLKLFEKLAVNQDKVLQTLCDSFNAEIENPDGKAHYDALAQSALHGIPRAFNEQSAERVTQDRNAILPSPDEKPIAANLQLVTWLVIKNKDNV